MNIKRLRKILDYLCEKDMARASEHRYFQKGPDGYYIIEGFQCITNGNNKVNHKQDSYLTTINLDAKAVKIKGFSYDGHKGNPSEITEVDVEFSDLSDHYFETNFKSVFEQTLKEEEAQKAQEKYNKILNKKMAKFLKE